MEGKEDERLGIRRSGIGIKAKKWIRECGKTGVKASDNVWGEGEGRVCGRES